MHIGLKGTMNALFLENLRFKTRRGQVGRAKAGRIPGGRLYGYDVVKGEEHGLRTIYEPQAEIVRRRRVADGHRETAQRRGRAEPERQTCPH
jgi:hypothetical protein